MSRLTLRPSNPMGAALQGFDAMDRILNRREDRKVAALDRERRIGREDKEDLWLNEQRNRTRDQWEREDLVRQMTAARITLNELYKDKTVDEKVEITQQWAEQNPELARHLMNIDPMLSTPESRQKIFEAGQNVHQAIQTGDTKLGLDSLNYMFQSQINKGGSKPGTTPVEKRIGNFIITEDGGVAFDVETLAKDDETGEVTPYHAGLSQERGGGEDDPVRVYSPEQIVVTVDNYMAFAKGLDMARIAAGDPVATQQYTQKQQTAGSNAALTESFNAAAAAYNADAAPIENIQTMMGAALQVGGAEEGAVGYAQVAEQVAGIMNHHENSDWIAVDFQSGSEVVSALVDKSKLGKDGVTAGNWKDLQKQGALTLLGQGPNAELRKANAALLNARRGEATKVTATDRRDMYEVLVAPHMQAAIDKFKKDNEGAIPPMGFGDPKLAEKTWRFVLRHSDPATRKMLEQQLKQGESLMQRNNWSSTKAALSARDNWDRSNPEQAGWYGKKFVVGKPKGLARQGNIDINSRPVVKNGDGSISTLKSITVTLEDGRALLIPTITEDGRVLNKKQAIKHAKKTNKHLGIFKNTEAANAYAKKLSEYQGRKYSAR